MKLTKQIRLRSFDHGQRRDCLASRLSLVTPISKSPTPNFEEVRDSLEARQSRPSKPILGLRGMWGQPRSEAVPSERGLAFIEFALIVPLFVAFLLMSFYVAIYIRTWSAVNYAAKEAAKAASLNSAYTKLNFDNIPTDRPQLEINMEQCRASTLGTDPNSVGAAKFLECIQQATASGAVSALLPADYTGNEITANQKYHLPFSLFEQPTNIPGYFPVQVLPMIGIERSCREPSNETSSNIGAADKRCYGANCTGGCNHVKPTYWQSPVHADFDRDGKEDLVFFRPHGTNASYGDMSAPGEMDFIVMKSGNAYSFFGGHGYMNLTTEPNTGSNGLPDHPYPIPVVADYDRDGVADYAVFEPSTGTIRIALSTTRYRIIIESTVPITDPTDGIGLIAIPGTYHSTSEMEVAIIPTATSNPATRYNIQFAKPEIPPYQVMKNWARGTYPVNTNISNMITEAKYKPRPGQSSVPAFGDYDDDGITEIGYLSYPGGNLAKQIAGKVPNLNNPAEVANASIFPTQDSYSDPMQVRMNPFDMAMDSAGNMYYSDAVDGRIWKVRGDGGNNGVRGDFRGAAVEVVVGSHAVLPPRDVRQANFDPQNDFPRENVWNVPPDLTTLGASATTIHDNDPHTSASPSTPTSIAAGQIILSTPRKMVIGPDDTMYIADFGNGRIVRIDGSSGLSMNSNATVILGSNTMPACPPSMVTFTQCNILVKSDGTRTGQKFHPSAVEIIPDPINSSRYSLAFSAGYNVYLLSPPNSITQGGPTGSGADLLSILAGTGQLPPSFNVNLIPEGGPGQPALGMEICPISSLKYDAETKTLFGASSCSLTPVPYFITYPIQESFVHGHPRATTISGILAFNPLVGNDITKGATMTRLIGGFWNKPCSYAKCSEPISDPFRMGVYQRKVDISASGQSFNLSGPNHTINKIDLINVTSLALGPKPIGSTDSRPLVFIDQWNKTPIHGSLSVPDSYPRFPNRTDEQHQQGIYMVERDYAGSPTTIQAITNPYSYGGGTIPVESAMWKTAALSVNYIAAQEGPIKTIPFPAISTVLIDAAHGKLYSATPHLALPGDALNNPSLNNPFWSDNTTNAARNIGFIYKADLDLDGDGIDDFQDTDIDGDSAASGNEASDFGTQRSIFCAEVDFGNGLQACRPQEKIGNPIQYFFKATEGQNIVLANGEPGDTADTKYREYFFFNSVAGDSSGMYTKARPEVWATLLSFGDDSDYDSTPSPYATCNPASEVANPSDPYYRCRVTSNGPIAAPAPLFSFVSSPCTDANCDTASQSGYRGNSYLSSVSGGHPGQASTDTGTVSNQLFLFPALLSSTMPKENGIKPVRRPIEDTSSTKPYTSGIMCLGGELLARKGLVVTTHSQPNSGPIPLPEPQIHPFGLDLTSYLSTYQFIRPSNGTVSDSSDNDNLSYMPSCAPPSGPVATEGIILQLNHNHALGHPNGLNGTANTRQLLMLDTDGDGARNGGTWLTNDAFDESVRSLVGKGALNLVSSDVRALYISDNNQVSSLAPFKLARQPWGIPEVSTQFPVAPYSDSDGALAGLPANNPRAYDSARLTTGNPNKMMKVALDFDNRFGAKFSSSPMQGDAAVGASMNAKYVSQDFSEGGAVVAGQNALKLSLGATIVNEDAALNAGEGRVKPSPSGDSIRVSYKPKIPLFPTIEVESKISAVNQLSAAPE